MEQRGVAKGSPREPHRTFCPRCRKHLPTVRQCKPLLKMYYQGVSTLCPPNKVEATAQRLRWPADKMIVTRSEFDDRVPNKYLCEDCLAEEKKFQALEKEGGLRFICRNCGAKGILKPSAYTRKHRDIALSKGKIKKWNDPFRVYIPSCPRCKGNTRVPWPE